MFYHIILNEIYDIFRNYNFEVHTNRLFNNYYDNLNKQ